MLWFNYVVSFSDGLQKVGVTSQPFFRLQDHILEALRHGLRINRFDVTGPVAEKATADKIKRAICELFSHLRIPDHRDWLQCVYGTDTTPMFEDFTDPERKEYGWPPKQSDAVWHELQMQWEQRASLPDRCLESDYRDFQEFLSELGKNGAPIKPAIATKLAATLICPWELRASRQEGFISGAESQTGSEDSAWYAWFRACELELDRRCKAVLA